MMTNENQPIDERYFNWLLRQIDFQGSVDDYTMLLSHLHCRPFIWSIPNDDNREVDGLNLRKEFLRGRETPLSWINMECSILEMLIGVSRHMADREDKEVPDRFWLLIYNLNIYLSNAYYDEYKVDYAINRINTRNIDYDGYGGLFPLKYPETDQAEVEIWYQMMSYIMENDSLYH